MSNHDETVFADVFIPLRDDPVSRVMRTFLFDDDDYEDNLFWQEISQRLKESPNPENNEIVEAIGETDSETDMYIGGAKPNNQGDGEYINMLFYCRNDRENDDSHFNFVQKNIIDRFNELTGRSKGNDGIFIHMADTTNRCFVLTDGKIPVYMDVVEKHEKESEVC